jgi:hypothetical protein
VTIFFRLKQEEIKSWDSSVSIVTSYGLDAWGLILGKIKFFVLSIASRPAHPSSYPMGTRADFPKGKVTEA